MSAVYPIVAADIGGTHARFAIAEWDGVAVRPLNAVTKLQVADYPSLEAAFAAFRDQSPHPLPRDAALAVATTVREGTLADEIDFPNSPWTLRPSLLREALGFERLTLLNDFGAICHAVNEASPSELAHVCGPQTGLPTSGVITVMGPGTGLGVAFVTRASESARVYETEASHISFAPLDEVEERILHQFQTVHERVSVERVLAGSGLHVIYTVQCDISGVRPRSLDDRDLWSLALGGNDPIASAALDRYCLCLGSAAGDFALAQGAKAIVIAGGLGQRIGERLNTSGFRERMVFKGRFSALMDATPVYRTQQPEPGLAGAAIAFAKEHLQ